MNDFPIQTSIYEGFSVAMLVITRWYIPLNPIKPPFSYGFPMVWSYSEIPIGHPESNCHCHLNRIRGVVRQGAMRKINQRNSWWVVRFCGWKIIIDIPFICDSHDITMLITFYNHFCGLYNHYLPLYNSNLYNHNHCITIFVGYRAVIQYNNI